MEATALQWLNLAINSIGVAALVYGAKRVGEVLATIEVHSKELEENRKEHAAMWERMWEIKK